jgi:ubiquitin carboxyl-terminal hydrolase 12/46
LINQFKKKTGVTSIKKLLSYSKKRNEMFKGDYHQDCHEFLMWYLNEIDDVLLGKHKGCFKLFNISESN